MFHSEEVVMQLFELGNVEGGSLYFEVESGRDKHLQRLFKRTQKELAHQGQLEESIVLPIKIEDKFYHLNLTNFESPDPARRSTFENQRSSFSTTRGSTIPKSQLKAITKEVKITFSNNIFLKMNAHFKPEFLKEEISRQFGRKAAELRQFKANRHGNRDGKQLFIKMKEPDVRHFSEMELCIDDREKVNLQVEYYKYKIAGFARIHGFDALEKTEMVRHLHQIENSIETILRYQ